MVRGGVGGVLTTLTRGVGDGGFFEGDEARHLPPIIVRHWEVPSIGALGRRGAVRAGAVLEGGAGAVVVLPGVPDLVISAPIVTVPWETSVVTLGHSPLVRALWLQVSAKAWVTGTDNVMAAAHMPIITTCFSTGVLPTTALECQ